MLFFSLTQDFTLVTDTFQRQYRASTSLAKVQPDRLYLMVGQEAQLIKDKLKQSYLANHPELDDGAKKSLKPSTVGLNISSEAALMPWPLFPARLGRISSRLIGDGLHFHQETVVLPAQLQALRVSKPDKQHFRFAVVNGFGSNLGDCSIGMTAFRQVLQCLAQELPSISCDILFGAGASSALADMVGFDQSIERILSQAPTACEFTQYDGYFDFSSIIDMPKYDELPTVDWYLWWCGLDPDAVPPAHKRNQSHIRWNAWNSVLNLLKDKPGKKILFNPKASVPLRTMPTEAALQFATKLLELSPDMTLVIDQPLGLKHKCVVDLSGDIESPEKFRALCGLVDGVITVDSLAVHAADPCGTPTVCLYATLPGSRYPYYPFAAAVNPKGYEQLPAFNKVKVSEEEWVNWGEAYHLAWDSISPAEVLALLHEKMAQRDAAKGEPKGLILVAERSEATCVDIKARAPRLARQRLTPEHARASERLAHLTQNILKPGSVCLLACAPDPSLAIALERRVAPHGELIILEPRTLLARSLESSLLTAGAFASRVQQSTALAGARQSNIMALEPWSESLSSEWGNTQQAISVPNKTVDEMALETCNCLMVQSPMPFSGFIAGATETLKRCRPFIFITPIGREQAGSACKAALEADYAFWAEAALPGKDMSSMLLVGVPQEKKVKMDGFLKVEVT